MCLETIGSYKDDPSKIEQAYKDGHFEGSNFVTYPRRFIIPSGQWVRENNDQIFHTEPWIPKNKKSMYESGFHCYQGPLPLVFINVWRVCFVKEIVARGQQVFSVVVAKKIYIPRQGASIFTRDFWVRHFGARFLPKEEV